MKKTAEQRAHALAEICQRTGVESRHILKLTTGDMAEIIDLLNNDDPPAPFGYWHQGATEEESDFFKASDFGHVGCANCIELYTHPAGFKRPTRDEVEAEVVTDAELAPLVERLHQRMDVLRALAKLRHVYQNLVNGGVRDTASAKRIAVGLLEPAIEELERAVAWPENKS
jgi:hypothetical protein